MSRKTRLGLGVYVLLATVGVLCPVPQNHTKFEVANNTARCAATSHDLAQWANCLIVVVLYKSYSHMRQKVLCILE